MNTSLALPSQTQWDALATQARALITSKFFPSSITTPEQAIVVKMYGDMLGIPWVAAMNTINVIQGKPTISPQLMIALARRTGQLEDLKIEADDNGATVTVTRKGQTPYTETFTMTDAKKLGLDSKDNYRKQPKTMLKWRAVAAAFRVVFPDAILGFYTPDEMGADVNTTEDGDMRVLNPDPIPDPRAISTEWRNKWIDMVEDCSSADLIAALGIKRWGEWDWLAPDAIDRADELVNAYLVNRHTEQQRLIDAPEAETDTNAIKAGL